MLTAKIRHFWCAASNSLRNSGKSRNNGWGRRCDHKFLRFPTIFDEIKIGVFFKKNRSYDPKFAKTSSILNRKSHFFSPNFMQKCFLKSYIDPTNLKSQQ
jgi:hypothetical protein